MSRLEPSILVYGFGNPGRADDGLGPAAAHAIAEWQLPNVTVDSNYQLQVEDTEALSQHDLVVFVDADVSCEPPYHFRRIEPSPDITFSTHSVAPASLLSLAEETFGFAPPAWLLGIRGEVFNTFDEHLSPAASANLDAALLHLRSILAGGEMDQLISARTLPSLWPEPNPMVTSNA